MTHLDDETLSAMLDDEAEPESRAHAERCRACGGRLRRLDAARSLIATPVPTVPPSQHDAAIAAAMAAQVVVPFRGRNLGRWAAGVAAVAAALVALALLPQVRDDDDPQTTAAPSAELEGSTTQGAPFDGPDTAVAADQGDEDAAENRSSTAAAPGSTIDLGELAGRDLSEVLAPYLDGDGAEQAEPPACETEARADVPGAGGVLFAGRGSHNGQPVHVLVFAAGAGRQARVLDETCQVIVRGEV